MSVNLVINGKFLSVPMTGVHRVAHELANAIADLGGGEAGAEVWHPHDGVERARSIRLPCRTVGPLRGIPWEQLTLPMSARGRLLLNLCNIAPVAATNAVTMIHDAQIYTTPESYRPAFAAWYRMIQPQIARRHRHILTVSEYSKQQLIAVGVAPAERISVVYNGVDHVVAVPARPAILDRFALGRKQFVVALASTQKHKNIRLLLRAFADPAMGHLKLVLIGSDASVREEFGAMLRENVVLTGRIDDGELRALYEAALCVAFPSTTEGFGLPPLEAMRVGCPAIVAPCGSLPEVCGDAALYADASSTAAWVSAFLELAHDEQFWLGRASAGRAHAMHFTWRRAAQRLLEVLDGVRCADSAGEFSPQRAAA